MTSEKDLITKNDEWSFKCNNSIESNELIILVLKKVIRLIL
jgi:hypothetical protein